MLLYVVFIFVCHSIIGCEASRGAAVRGVTAKPTGYGFDPHSRR